MGTIPFPNIPEEAGQIAQAPANAFAQGVGIRGAQQEQQERSLQMEQQRRQLADQDALTKAMTSYDPQKHTLADFPKLITQNGGSGQAALTAQSGLIQQRRNLSSLSDEQFAQEQKKSDLRQGVHDQVTSAPPEQKQQVYTQGLQTLARAGDDVSQEPQQYPGDDVFAQHLPAIRLHSALIAEADKDRELTTKETEASTKQQEANAKDWEKFPELGVMVNARTGEQKSVTGGLFMPPAMMESKYVALQQRKNSGQPLDPSDAAWVKGFEKYKTLVPQFNLNQNLTGGGMIPGAGQPGGQGGAPPTIENVPPSIAGKVKAIYDYRAPMPPQGRGNPTNSAISYWVNQLDPQHDETNFPARNKLMTAFTSGKESQQINAINTAMGHVGVLGDAIDALNNTNVPALNAIANKLGVAIGNTPAATFKTIVHRVGPELAAAYIQGGGGEAERGTTADDFSADKGTDQLKSNVGITAKLLRSKIGSLENQYKNTMKRDDFNERFITPEAKATLDTWSPKGGPKSGAQSSGKSVSLAAARQLPQNKGKSDDEIKKDIEAYGHTVAP